MTGIITGLVTSRNVIEKRRKKLIIFLFILSRG